MLTEKLTAALAAIVVFALADARATEVPAPAPARSMELLHLLRHDCGSCHGLSLAGGLGPPLLAADLRDKPAENLRHVILNGRPGSAMPGWSAFLNESEAAWLVEILLKGLADED
jgi:cytochrome c55X